MNVSTGVLEDWRQTVGLGYSSTLLLATRVESVYSEELRTEQEKTNKYCYRIINNLL